MPAYLVPGKELAVLALGGRSNPSDGFRVWKCEIMLPTGSPFVEVILKDYLPNI